MRRADEGDWPSFYNGEKKRKTAQNEEAGDDDNERTQSKLYRKRESVRRSFPRITYLERLFQRNVTQPEQRNRNMT